MGKRGKFVVLFLLILLIGIYFISAFNLPNLSNFHIFNFNKNVLKVTNEHPFFLDGKWINASDLKVGDELTLVNGKKARIKSIEDIVEDKEVYNIHVNGSEDYFANSVLVHNKPVPTGNIDRSKVDYIPGKDVDIPIPPAEQELVLDREFAEFLFTEMSPAEKAAAMKVIDNTERIDFNDFRNDLLKATERFSEQVKDEPYVLVLKSRIKSNSWAYEIAREKLGREPDGIVFLLDSGYTVSDYPLDGWFDKGIRNFVIFDDASYSGTQLASFEYGGEIPIQFSEYMKNARNPYPYKEGINYYAVTSAASDIAEKRFEVLNRKYATGNADSIRSTLISERKIKTLEQILDEDELQLLFHYGFQGDQTATYFAHNVPDALSLPTRVARSIFIGDSGIQAKPESGKAFSPPYKNFETDYAAKWLQMGSGFELRTRGPPRPELFSPEFIK